VIRVFLTYQGRDYTIAGRAADEVCEEIEQKLVTGRPAWLTVSTGEGRFQESRLLLQPGVSISVTPIDEDGREQGERELRHAVQPSALPDH
jgi:hypothetical protein